MEQEDKIKKYKWLLNRKDFKFIDNFCEKEKVKRGKNIETKLAYFLNEYKKYNKKPQLLKTKKSLKE